jgi:hypothetical protein
MSDNPIAITFIIFLSLISGVLCWRGFRGKNLPSGIMGIAVGIPTFAITDWQLWVLALITLGFGYWLKQKMENI